AVAAEHRGVAGDLLDKAQRVGERRAFGEGVGELDENVDAFRERLDGLAAAHERARHDARDPLPGERLGDRARLPAAALRQWAELIVARPRLPAARLGVADEEEGHPRPLMLLRSGALGPRFVASRDTRLAGTSLIRGPAPSAGASGRARSSDASPLPAPCTTAARRPRR